MTLAIATDLLAIVVLAGLAVTVAWHGVMSLRAAQTTGNMIVAHDKMRKAFDFHAEATDLLRGWVVPPAEWAEVIELHQSLRDLGADHRDYLIYCARNGGYWAQGDWGYTNEADKAKRFTAAEGLLLVLDRSRNGDPDDCYTLVAIGKPIEDQ